MPKRPDSYERMPFLKLYSREWLQGSLRVQNDSAERGVWADFLALANESRNRGVIQANNETPYPHSYLASVLNIPQELLERCILKFTQQERIYESEVGIVVLNFSYWQGLDTRRRGRPSKRRPEPKTSDPMLMERQNRISIAGWERRKKTGSPLAYEERLTFIAELDKELEEKYGRSVEDALGGKEQSP